PTEQVKSPRPSIQHVETSIPPATHKTAIPKPTSNGNRKNMKACFVCKILDHLIKDYDYHAKKMVQPTARNHAHRGTHKQYAQLILPNRQRHVVPTTVLTKSKPVPITAARIVISAVPNYPSLKASNSPLRVTAVKALVVNAAQCNSQHALKDKGVINSGCSRHMIGNMPYLSDFEELNGGYVAFRGNPKGGKISSKGKIRTGKLDFADVYFVKELKFNLFSVSQIVPRENNMYNVNLKTIVLSVDLTCLFAKATIDESNLWHKRLGHIDFKTMNKLVKGKFNGKVDEGFLVGYFVSSKAFSVFNSRTRIVQETLHVNFLENKPNVAGSGPKWLFNIDTLTKTMNYQPVTAGNQTNPSTGKKPEFEVNVSPSSSAQSKKHDDKTKREAKGKIHVESLTGYRNLSAKFEDFSDNSINELNVADTLVPVVGQFTPNSTNTFSVAGPSNDAASPTHGKYSCIDTSQYPNDLDMP
nr:hypothetical protein [Tanacetum cinerariifolium]